MLRTQHYMYEVEKKRPVQVQTYLVAGSWFNVIRVAIFGAIFTLFTKFKCTCSLLLNVRKYIVNNAFLSQYLISTSELRNAGYAV